MIPEFPEFKKLELSDKEDVEKFTSKYPPYADHNFLGTWSWDVREQMQISQLDGNYVIHFSSYDLGERFYTFLGDNNINNTIRELIDLSKKQNLKPELKLIPEAVIGDVDKNLFNVLEDRDHFDYVYDIEELKNYKGGKFESKRRESNNFTKKYQNAKVVILDLRDKNIQKNILGLYKRWSENKLKKEPEFNFNHEIIVLEKFFSASDKLDLISVGVFIDSELVAFCIDELKKSEYAISHVIKADPLFTGAYSFLMQRNAEILYTKGKKYFNYEQDVGSPSLRVAKTLFRPCFFLKKYLIAYKNL
ncbi:phosphatidylglycerol lysyltransferase domain-containing protein [Candidatus Nomurabacteria bacterium]|nr:phosphatidylglycerol lysyltransferase domain-containing protein [Candidatus Nomurabacteria bacterium]